MKVSIITVAYNSAATILDTIKSVAAQTYPNIEYIIIDGASADNSLSIIKPYEHVVTKLVSEPDGGIYDAMNKGLMLATGEIVGFLNADDIFAHPKVVASIVQTMQLNPNAEAIYGDLEYVSQTNVNQVLRYWRSGEFSHLKLHLGWMPPHPTFYVRTRELSEKGYFNTKLRIAADYDFVLRFLGKEGVKTAYIRDVLVRMRIGGVSNRSWKTIIRKSREDLWVIRSNRVGGLLTLFLKNMSKVSQFILRS